MFTSTDLLLKRLLILIGLLSAFSAYAQNDVMMQAFYWDVPVDETNKNGTWWDNLNQKSDAMKSAGFTGLWVPAPSKGNFGIVDMGYGVFDHYDLGNYDQKGTIETRFGSRSELEAMITKMHSNNIEVYADIILNHIYTNEDQAEDNPAVKAYVFDEAYRNGAQFQAYPTNEITWVIPNAAIGDYFIQIKGYLLPWSSSKGERGYDVYIDWTGAGPNGTPTWENEPNNGGGQFNVFPGSGRTMQAHIEDASDIDEYKISLSTPGDIIIKLTAKREEQSPFQWVWAPQENGYYPGAIWHNGINLAPTVLQAHTNTGINYVNHTGTGEPNYSWDYTHFHPADNNDLLGFAGSDEIITNTKFFGNDLNTFNTTVQARFKDWGAWMANEIKFDGFRLDFVRGFQESYVADWVSNLPLLNGQQRFVVGEYWGGANRIKDWVNAVASQGADVDGFDFPLKNTLTDMCNGNQSSFDMNWLNHAGMVRNNGGQSLPGTSVVTFVDNHDTGKEHDKWVIKDFKMAYAYMLTHEGRPCVFYPHYYGITQIDNHDATKTITPPASLHDDINKLIFIRKTYLDGGLAVLSKDGNPYPEGDTYHVYAARRQGNANKSGAIITINNHDTTTKGLWVDSSPTGYTDLANITLVNALDPSQTTVVQSDGRVYVSAPPRGYAVWVKQNEYEEYMASASSPKTLDILEADKSFSSAGEPTLGYKVNQNYPNPFYSSTNIGFEIPDNGKVVVKIFNEQGEMQQVLLDDTVEAGFHELTWEAPNNYRQGTYYYTVSYNKKMIAKRVVLIK